MRTSSTTLVGSGAMGEGAVECLLSLGFGREETALGLDRYKRLLDSSNDLVLGFEKRLSGDMDRLGSAYGEGVSTGGGGILCL